LTADGLAARLAGVRAAIERAAERAGRGAATVRIVAVTKTHPPAAVAAALAAGLRDVGESYVQEARAKRAAVGTAGAVWHMVGGLQRNKVRAAVAVFDRVHSVDSVRLAAALGAAAADAGRRLPVLIEVNVGGERSKRGVAPGEVEALGQAVLGQPALALEGLMTVAPWSEDPERVRPCFRLLRELRDRAAARLGVELPHLSMGMSDDFAVAVEEGATWVRLGRVLFGARSPGAWRPDPSAGGESS
jgi:pyridoxal phosphate enzyme (YggS family)